MNKKDGTTIWVTNALKHELDNLKHHDREPYYQVIGRLIPQAPPTPAIPVVKAKALAKGMKKSLKK